MNTPAPNPPSSNPHTPHSTKEGEPSKGDYVLATKYSDGDPRDHWAVGFYDRMEGPDGNRHFIVDGEGKQLRANGFRRVGRITHDHGKWLLENAGRIEQSDRSLWSFAETCDPLTAHSLRAESGGGTPRTDSVKVNVCLNWDNRGDQCRDVVPADFARTLEKQLNNEMRETSRAWAHHDQQKSRAESAEKQLAEAREEVARLTEVDLKNAAHIDKLQVERDEAQGDAIIKGASIAVLRDANNALRAELALLRDGKGGEQLEEALEPLMGEGVSDEDMTVFFEAHKAFHSSQNKHTQFEYTAAGVIAKYRASLMHRALAAYRAYPQKLGAVKAGSVKLIEE